MADSSGTGIMTNALLIHDTTRMAHSTTDEPTSPRRSQVSQHGTKPDGCRRQSPEKPLACPAYRRARIACAAVGRRIHRAHG